MRRLSSAGPRGRAHFGHPPLHDQDDSVGFARQYCGKLGKLGKQDNCQVAVNLSVASDQASLPIAVRLYLLEAWANDNTRRKEAAYRLRSRSRPSRRSPSAKYARRSLTAYRRHRACRCRLRQRHGFPRRADRDGLVLHCRRAKHDRRVGAGNRAAAGPALERPREEDQTFCVATTAPNQQKSAISPCSPAQGLEDRTLARRDQGPSRLTLCRRAGATIASRLFGGPSPGAKSGCRSSGPRARMHQPSTGSRRCLTPHRSPRSSTQQSCAGALSATSRICNRRSVSITTRVEDGEASTTMRRSRSRPTASCPPNGVRFPPQLQSNTRSRPASRRRSNASSRVVTPLRPKRHTALSITTLRRQLAKRLPRCPCCMRKRAATHASRL